VILKVTGLSLCQKEEKTVEIENVSFFPCPELRNVI
jgi:hypothetical protein